MKTTQLVVIFVVSFLDKFISGIPIIVRKITVVAGTDSRMILSCPFFGYLPAKWKKDGRPIISGSRFVTSGANLIVSDINQNDEGTYTCKSTHIYGYTIKARFQVTVNKSPIILRRRKEWQYKIGSTAIIDCKANGKPKPDVFWINEQGYSPINPPKITQIRGSSLKIRNFTERDARVLICIAQNMHGRARAKFSIHTADSIQD